MIDVTWKRNRDGSLEAYKVKGERHHWIGVVNGTEWYLLDRPITFHRAPTEGEAMVALVEAYQGRRAA